MRSLPIFLILAILLIGCSAPESNQEYPKNATQTTTPQTQESQTTTPESYDQDAEVEGLERELQEIERVLTELESLENVSFEI